MSEQLGYDLDVVEDIIRDANDRRAQRRMAQWTEKDWQDNENEMDDSPHYTDYENTDWEHDYNEDASDDEGRAASGSNEENLVQRNVGRAVTEAELFRIRASQRPIDEDYFGPTYIFFDLKIDTLYFGRIVIRLSRFNHEVERHFTKLATDNALFPRRHLHTFECSSIYKKSDKFFEGGVMMPLNAMEAESIYTPQPVSNSAYYDKYTMIANENINDSYNGGRYLITYKKMLHCDPGHIPVGVVVKGRHLIDQLQLLPCEDDGFLSFKVWVQSCGTLTRHDLIRGGGSWERSRETDNFIRLGAHLNKRVRTHSPNNSDDEYEYDSESEDEEEERSRPRRRVPRRHSRRNGTRETTQSP